MATEANWWEQNNNGQGSSSLNPGINEETIRPDWVDYMEDYDMDDFLIPEQNGNTDHAEGRPPNRGKRFTNEQLDIFKSAFRVCDHPDESMRQELAEKIGIDAQQVKFWFQNRRTKIKLKARGNENKEIRKENAQLRAENMKLFQQLQCGKCRDVNPMDEKWRIANENARLMGMKQRAQGYLIKLINEAPLPHSEMLGHVASASLHQVPFIESISTKQAMLLAYAERALSEFMMLARNGEPLWQRCATGKMLNRQEYKRHTFPGLLGPCPEGFVIESSKETSFVRGRPYELVDIITDVSRWSKMFPGIIAGVRKSNVITSGPLTPQNGLLQEMNVDLWVQSPQAPNRRMKFLRFSRQIEGMWAVVDVSPMDSMRGIEAEGNQIGYMGCRLLPSGCLLEDIDSTGFTKVTWIVHVEYNDTIVSPPFKSFFQSGQALGASRWLALLQRQCEYMSNQDSSYSSDMSDLGRRSVLDLAKRMMASFYTAMSKPFTLKQPSNNVRNWRGRCKIRADMFGVTVRMVIWNCSTIGEPPALVLSATTTLWVPGIPPQFIHDYLCNGQRRGEWDRFSFGSAVEELSSVVTCQQLHGNAVSIIQPSHVADQANSNMLVLQETTSDISCSLVVYSFVEKTMMCAIMDGGDNTSVFLLPSGFSILPDGHGKTTQHVAASASSSSALTGRSSTAGSILTAGYQAILPGSGYKHAIETMDNAGNRVCQAMKQILAGIGAEYALPAA